MKKFILGILLVVVTLSLFVACAKTTTYSLSTLESDDPLRNSAALYEYNRIEFCDDETFTVETKMASDGVKTSVSGKYVRTKDQVYLYDENGLPVVLWTTDERIILSDGVLTVSGTRHNGTDTPYTYKVTYQIGK